MKKTLLITLLSGLLVNAYAGSDKNRPDGYPLSFNCESGQSAIESLNIQIKDQTSKMIENNLPGAYLFKNFELKLNCENIEYDGPNLFGLETATKASIEVSVPTCQSVNVNMQSGDIEYSLLPENLDVHFSPNVGLLGYNSDTDEFIQLFRAKGIRVDRKIGLQYTNFVATAMSFPNCF